MDKLILNDYTATNLEFRNVTSISALRIDALIVRFKNEIDATIALNDFIRSYPKEENNIQVVANKDALMISKCKDVFTFMIK
mgnify:CR=1 FL=1